MHRFVIEPVVLAPLTVPGSTRSAEWHWLGRGVSPHVPFRKLPAPHANVAPCLLLPSGGHDPRYFVPTSGKPGARTRTSLSKSSSAPAIKEI